jgi:methylmalonyl-CoA mutase C-terminal domain/subunit
MVGVQSGERGRGRRRLCRPPEQEQEPATATEPSNVTDAMKRRYRVVIAKPGLDGHDRGAKVIARALRDAGFEVIYTGLHQTPEQVAETALQEDADAVGLSVLSGAHNTLFPRVVSLLREKGVGDVLVFGGGIIPEDDVPELERAGVAAVFTPGASLSSISGWLEEALDAREPQLTT